MRPRTRALAFLVASGLLAALVGLLDGGLYGIAATSLGGILLASSAFARGEWGAWTGLALVLLGTGFTQLVPVVGLGTLIVLVVGIPLVVALVYLITTGDPEPALRPSPPSRAYQARFAGLTLVLLAVTLGPLVLTPVRLVLASEMGTTIAVLLAAGAGLLVYATPLVATEDETEQIEADELEDRGVAFGVMRRRYAKR